jgi:hypothetical protein
MVLASMLRFESVLLCLPMVFCWYTAGQTYRDYGVNSAVPAWLAAGVLCRLLTLRLHDRADKLEGK